jgi:phosphoribosyl 1,2-cyclic phosphodiesterase
MLTFEPHASGSAGNLYTATDGRTSIMIEAGLPIRQTRKALGFGVSGLAGCLVSHEHGDHARGVPDIMKAGVDCYMSRGTAEALGVTGHRVRILEPKKPARIATLTVMPFDVQHDAAEPLGFLIVSDLGGRLLYVTDTPFVRYRFGGLTIIALEANFSLEIMRRRTANGDLPAEQYRRVLRNHMSIERAIELLEANDLSQVEAIHLLHLSDGNSDEAAFVDAVARATGKPVYSAPARRAA